MSILIRHEVIAELTEAAEADGETLTDWVLRLPECRWPGATGWRVLPCGCLVVEPLEDAMASLNHSTQEKVHA